MRLPITEYGRKDLALATVVLGALTAVCAWLGATNTWVLALGKHYGTRPNSATFTLHFRPGSPDRSGGARLPLAGINGTYATRKFQRVAARPQRAPHGGLQCPGNPLCVER